MMGKKLEKIEKLGINFFFFLEGGSLGWKGVSVSQRAPKHTTLKTNGQSMRDV